MFARRSGRLPRLAMTALLLVTGGMALASPMLAWAQDAAQVPGAGAPGAVAEGAAKPAAAAQGEPWYVLMGIVVALFVGSGMLGNYLAKATRLPDQGLKFGVVIFSIAASLAVTVMGWPPKLGIDLSGGVILVYEVDQSQKMGSGDDQKVDMDKLVGAISRRVNPGGIKEVTVRPYGLDQIEIIIPEASQEELAGIKDLISRAGSLEFRILASRRNNFDLVTRAEQSKDKNVMVGGKLEAKWVPMVKEEESYYRDQQQFAVRENKRGQLEILVLSDPENVTGDYLRNASAAFDQKGKPCVKFSFDASGARLFGELTTSNMPDPVQPELKRYLAIILDGELFSAPAINSPIFDQGEITGKFTIEQTKSLAAVLTAGQLPAVLHKEPSSSMLAGPTLGADTIRKGVNSMLVSTLVVVLFMLFYYRFAGVVANIAVVLNVLLTLAFMILFNAAFTLSGLAGLALTVGMAVDANVLIYERMREEMARGATLRMAIRNGFDRATTTIIDANVTTLISAVVLFAIGTDQVKGFAVTLILGILMNLFTAITVSRVCFDVAEKTRFLTNLKMMQILSGSNYDFIGKRKLAIGASLVVIAIGMIGVYERGTGLLDIDFTGGVSVETLFAQNQHQDVAKVREEVSDLPDVTVQDVNISGEPKGTRFLIVTSEPNIDKVETELKQKFKGKLAFNDMEIEGVTPLGANGLPTKAVEPAKTQPPAGKQPEPRKGAALQTADDDRLALAFFPDAPAEPKSDASPASDKAAADKAAADKKVADDKAAEDKAAAEKKAADAKLAADKAAADKAAADKKAAAEKLAADKAAADKKEAAKKEADKKEPEKKVEPKKPETPVTQPNPPAAPVTTTPAATPAAEAPATAKTETESKSDYADGLAAHLTFSEGINHDTLDRLIKLELQRDSKLSDTLFAVDNRDYVEGSDAPYKSWDVKLAMPLDQGRKILDQVKQGLADSPFFPSSNKIGATVAGNTKQQAVVALLASMLLIGAYVWFRFTQVMFGFAAILALVHDVLVTLGALALSYWLAPYLGFLGVEQFKINLPIIAAFLTIIGYSLNDTIVIFDRIREIRGKSPDLPGELVNTSINQTLSRTLLTSLTVFLVVLILYAMGGQGIHGFAFALVVGVVSGTYSTVYIATPVLIWLNRSTNSGNKYSSTGKKLPEPTGTR
jgi:SecD/SecF fusion protein